MQMKKILSLVLISIMTLTAAACTSKETTQEPTAVPKESSEEALSLIEEAMEKASEVTGYEGQIDLDFDFINTNGTMTANVITDIYVYDTYDRYIEINTNFNEGEETGRSEFYVKGPELVGGDSTLYMLYEGEWYQSPADDDTLYYLLGQYDLPEISRIFLLAATGAQIIEEQSVEGEKVTRVDAVIDEDVIIGTLIYTGVFVPAGMSTLTESHLAGAKAMPISFWFNEDGNLVKIAFDAGDAYQTISDNLFEAVRGLEGYEDAEKLVINTYEMEFSIGEINSTDRIDYPQDVLEAIEIEE